MNGKQAKRLRKYVQEVMAPKLPSLAEKSYERYKFNGQIRLIPNSIRAIYQRLKHQGVRVRIKPRTI